MAPPPPTPARLAVVVAVAVFVVLVVWGPVGSVRPYVHGPTPQVGEPLVLER